MLMGRITVLSRSAEEGRGCGKYLGSWADKIMFCAVAIVMKSEK